MVNPRIKLHDFNRGNPQEQAAEDLPYSFYAHANSPLLNLITGLVEQSRLLMCALNECCDQMHSELQSVRDIAEEALQLAQENKAWIDSQPGV